MSQYYTNVFHRSGKIYVRGYKDGVRYQEIIKYRPTLYIGYQGNDVDSPWKSFVTNQTLVPKTFDSTSEVKPYLETYEDVHGYSIHGQTDYAAQYIGDKWTKEVPFDVKQIDTMVIDIETTTEGERIFASNHKIKVRKK